MSVLFIDNRQRTVVSYDGMGKPPRIIGDDLIYHALNRGNNGQAVFEDDNDLDAFLQAMGQTQTRYPFRLYGYCLMPNHFHFLLKPEPGVSISRVIQSMTVAHTWRHHKRRQSIGHVWQGRFKSPVIQDDEHFWTVLRYIEANPLRARSSPTRPTIAGRAMPRTRKDGPIRF